MKTRTNIKNRIKVNDNFRKTMTKKSEEPR